MTKMEMFNTLRTMALTADNAELIDAIDHEIALLVKRASTPSKPDAKTIENASLKAEIVAVLREFARPMRISEVVENITGEYANPVTNGRVSSLLTSLVKENRVKRTEEKRIVYFYTELEG